MPRMGEKGELKLPVRTGLVAVVSPSKHAKQAHTQSRKIRRHGAAVQESSWCFSYAEPHIAHECFEVLCLPTKHRGVCE